MWQKGPGEGYMAAKDEAVRLMPGLVCRRVTVGPSRIPAYQVAMGAIRIPAYQVFPGPAVLASAASAREAWNKALIKLQKKGKTP